MKLVVLDVETGGLDPQKDSLLSVGAVVWEDGVLGKTIHFLVKEDTINAGAEALSINGLTVEQVENEGVSPVTAVAMLRQWLLDAGFQVSPGKVTMGGHNVAFDAGFIERLFRLANARNPFAYRRICTQSAALFLMAAGRANYNNTGLDALCRTHGIEIRAMGSLGKHNALEDAVATAKLLTKFTEMVQPIIPMAG